VGGRTRSYCTPAFIFCPCVRREQPQYSQGYEATIRKLRTIRLRDIKQLLSYPATNIWGAVRLAAVGIDCQLPPEVPERKLGIDYRALVEPKVFIGATTFVFLPTALQPLGSAEDCQGTRPAVSRIRKKRVPAPLRDHEGEGAHCAMRAVEVRRVFHSRGLPQTICRGMLPPAQAPP